MQNKSWRGIYSILHLLFILLLSTLDSHAAPKTINLTVSTKTVNFKGKDVETIAINDQIPAPTLHFKEGDRVTINIHNQLKEGTTIHWHGLIVPWYMDGVENVTQQAIPPEGTFAYSFPLKQSGTYWYHAHSGFQEQQGIYGCFIIDPIAPAPYVYTKDYPVVLSDWTNDHPIQVFANLKKDGDYYAPHFPLQPSLAKFISDYSKGTPEERDKIRGEYEMMQQMRMNIYDLSDIAYDAYLLNGQTKETPWTVLVQVGDTVRLRFIGAMASTIYQVKIPGAIMKVVHVQGHDVEPYSVENFTISPGETTDVLVTIEKDEPYIIYAESSDSLGKAYGCLITKLHQQVSYDRVEPFPEPKPVMMREHRMHQGETEHRMMTSNLEHDVSSPTTGTKYQDLKSPITTNDPNKPVQEIKMELSGYMGHFMWFINGLAEYEAKPILIEPGKRYRLIFTNTSMMVHPMHLHGHFFILRNGHGAYDPFLHTIEVPPGATVVADFDANERGQWFFHCHHLYHMMSGMSRVFRYSTFMDDYTKMPDLALVKETDSPQQDQEPSFVHHPLGHPQHLHHSLMVDLGYDPFHNVLKANLTIYMGWDRQKIQLYSEDAEIRKGRVESADLDIFYWHLLSEFWALKGGANIVSKPANHPYWQPGMGIEGLFPYFIYTNLRIYLHQASVKFDLQLSRDTQIAHNFFIKTGLRAVLATKSVKKDEIGRGLNYIEYIIRPYYALAPGISLFMEADFTPKYGNLKKILHKKGQSTNETVIMFGVSLLC